MSSVSSSPSVSSPSSLPLSSIRTQSRHHRRPRSHHQQHQHQHQHPSSPTDSSTESTSSPIPTHDHLSLPPLPTSTTAFPPSLNDPTSLFISNPNLDSDPAYLDTVEKELLEHIQTIQKQLNDSRQRRSLGKNRGLFRTNPSYSDDIHTHSPNSHPRNNISTHQEAPVRQRIISVSLSLPTLRDRNSMRQQLYDHALPPKAIFTLEQASDFPFVSVGTTGSVSSNPHDNHESFQNLQKVYGTQHRTSWRSQNNTRPRPNAQSPVHRYISVSLPDEPDILQKYQYFCNHILWRLLHYDYATIATDPDLEQYWNAYRIVNQRFAETISEIYEDGDLIWVHNYHLMLLPSLLRESLWYAKIGFFLYTPFPSAELFRILPYRTEILKGLIGADLIGFHSYDYAKQFVNSCSRLLGLDATPSAIQVDPAVGRKCQLGIYPAGIDVRALRNHVSSKTVKSRVAELRARFEGIKIIVGIDRLDHSFGGIPLKLLAFEKLLTDNPELIGNVILVQIATIPNPSRDIASYKTQQAPVNELVARINSTFGTLASSPVHYINSELEAAEIYALMCVGHVCIVSTVRDGMGLVPHEWTVCQHTGYRGPIVLSEFSGSAHSFSTALHVNPWDVDDVALKLKVALDMSDTSRYMRNEAAYRVVTLHTAKLWGFNFLEDLEQCEKSAIGGASAGAPLLDFATVISAYISSSANPSPISSSAVLSSMNAGYGQAAMSPQTQGEHISKLMRRGFGSAARLSFSPPAEHKGARFADFTGSEGTAKSALASPGHRDSSWIPPAEISTPNFHRAPRLKLFVLDLDGTLVPYQAISELGAPTPQVIDAIQALLDADPFNSVLVLSNRDRTTVAQWLGSLNIYLAAEDGAFFRAPGAFSWTSLFRDALAPDYSRPQDPPIPVAESIESALTAASSNHTNECETSLPGQQEEETPKKKLFVEIRCPDVTKQNGDTPKRKEKECNGTQKKSNDKELDEVDAETNAPTKHCPKKEQADQLPGKKKDIPLVRNKVVTLVAEKGEKSGMLGKHRGSFCKLGEHTKRGWNSFASLSSLESTQNGEAEVQKWKSTVLPVLQHFAERTPGVVLEEGDVSLTWHYIDSDTDLGKWQARELNKNLEHLLVQGMYIDLVFEAGKRRWIKVRSNGVDKTNAVVQTIQHMKKQATLLGEWDSEGELRAQVNLDFVICIGDDRADEGMFDFFKDEKRLDALGVHWSANRIFTCRVGSSPTSAKYSVESPYRVVELIEELGKQKMAQPH